MCVIGNLTLCCIEWYHQSKYTHSRPSFVWCGYIFFLDDVAIYLAGTDGRVVFWLPTNTPEMPTLYITFVGALYLATDNTKRLSVFMDSPKLEC